MNKSVERMNASKPDASAASTRARDSWTITRRNDMASLPSAFEASASSLDITSSRCLPAVPLSVGGALANMSSATTNSGRAEPNSCWTSLVPGSGRPPVAKAPRAIGSLVGSSQCSGAKTTNSHAKQTSVPRPASLPLAAKREGARVGILASSATKAACTVSSPSDAVCLLLDARKARRYTCPSSLACSVLRAASVTARCNLRCTRTRRSGSTPARLCRRTAGNSASAAPNRPKIHSTSLRTLTMNSYHRRRLQRPF